MASSENEENLCDIKITDFNTYEITCPKSNPNEVKESTTESSDESTTKTVAEESENLCCRLYRTEKTTSGTYISHLVVKTWVRGQPTDCASPETSDVKIVAEILKMVTSTSIPMEGNSCKVILNAELYDSEAEGM